MKIETDRRHKYATTLGFSCMLILLVFTAQGRAEIIDYIYQSGSNVTASYSGSIDTTDLSFLGQGANTSQISGSVAFQVFDGVFGSYNLYTGIVGPSSFGSGSDFTASSSSGSILEFDAGSQLGLPVGYTSGSAISGAEAFNSETLAGLGLTTGTYTYTFGTGAHADSLVVEIGTAPPTMSATPEPASLSLMLLAVVAMAYPVLLRRRSASA